MHLRGLSILVVDVDGGVTWEVVDEVAFPKLVDSLFDGHYFEGAQSLSRLKLLHVERT